MKLCEYLFLRGTYRLLDLNSYVTWWFEDHDGTIDMYDWYCRNISQVYAKRLRLCSDHITVLICITYRKVSIWIPVQKTWSYPQRWRHNRRQESVRDGCIFFVQRASPDPPQAVGIFLGDIAREYSTELSLRSGFAVRVQRKSNY